MLRDDIGEKNLFDLHQRKEDSDAHKLYCFLAFLWCLLHLSGFPTKEEIDKKMNRTRMRKNGSKLYLAFILPVFIYLLIATLYPLIHTLGLSFLKEVGRGGETVFVGLQNYISIVHKDYFWSVLGHSFYFSGVSVLGHLLIGLLFALLLNKPLKGREAWRALQFMPWLLPSIVASSIGILMFVPGQGYVNFLLVKLGLQNWTRDWLGDPKIVLSVITAVNIWTWYPFHTIMILAGLQNVPKALFDAAKIDGAGALKCFLHVTLPTIIPIILTICLLDFIWTFRFFDMVWIMTKGGPAKTSEVVATQVYKLAFHEYKFGEAAALGGIMIAIMVPFTLIYLKVYIRKTIQSE